VRFIAAAVAVDAAAGGIADLSHRLSDPSAKKMKVQGSWVCPAPSAVGYGNTMLSYPLFSDQRQSPAQKGRHAPAFR